MNSNVTGQEKDGNMSPPGGVREKEEYRQWAGHELQLEIEVVLDKKNLPIYKITTQLTNLIYFIFYNNNNNPV